MTKPFRLDDPIYAHIVDGDYHVIDGGEGKDSWTFTGFAPLDVARLMTASPLLLAALIHAREFIEAEGEHLLESFCVMRGDEPDLTTLDDDGRPYVQKVVDALAQIDAAIAVARGEPVPVTPTQEPT